MPQIDPTLEPCPFCGGPGVLEMQNELGGISYWNVGCKSTQCRGSIRYLTSAFPESHIDAEVALWNTRSLPTLPEMVQLKNPDRLRKWRLWRGLTLVPVAKRFGCTIVQLSQIERGYPGPRSLVAAIEKLLAQSPSD